MQEFVIIGCGSFGESVAKSLYNKGYDVMVIDKDHDRIQNIADDVTHAIQADAMDEAVLKSLGVRNFDVAVISFASDLQASILTTLLVKELGVKKVIAKARTDVHAKVLYKIGADRVVFPEREMGMRLAHSLVAKNILDYIDLDPSFSVVEITATKEWEDKTIEELQLANKHGMNVLAIKHNHGIQISPKGDYTIRKGDIIVGIASTEKMPTLDLEE